MSLLEYFSYRRRRVLRLACGVVGLALCAAGKTALAGDLSTPIRSVFVRPVAGRITPVNPPQPSDLPQSDAEAARFLTMATFGPTPQSIAELRTIGYAAWFRRQFDLPVTVERPTLEGLISYQYAPANGASIRNALWFQTVIEAPDQLRQRMAWALSQIFVVSDQNSSLGPDEPALAEYYDTLSRDAFPVGDPVQSPAGAGTYENLLHDITYSPAMGKMLSILKNQKANPRTGSTPDENYAREVMQLFSIGLIQRNSDFSPVLSGGAQVPTYTQATVIANAKVLTGLGYVSGFNSSPNSFSTKTYIPADYQPMVCYEAYHDETAKTLVDGSLAPGGANSCDGDIHALLHSLAMFPTTAAFLSRQLIERFTSSNPSPTYIARVAAIFKDDGHGQRGNLAAVLQGILMDPEVRHMPYTLGASPNFEKLREPLLKMAALYRYYNAQVKPTDYTLASPNGTYAQEQLHSPTVFNFYQPDYEPQGDLSDLGLYGPEFQLLNASTLFSTANDLTNRSRSYLGNTQNNPNNSTIDISALLAIAQDPTALIQQIDHDLLYDSMSPRLFASLVAMENQIKSSDAATKVTSALQLVLASPDFAIQR